LNRVPHEAVAEGEFRTFKPEVFAHAKASILALNGRGEVTSPADGYACQVKTEILTESRPWARNPGTDALFELFRKTSEELNIPLGCEERGGLSDGNLIWDAVPTIDGLGAWGDNDHCSERSPDGSKLPEYIIVSGIVPKALVNTVAIERLAEMTKRPGGQ
jgi:glutamate carboxypeptidase